MCSHVPAAPAILIGAVQAVLARAQTQNATLSALQAELAVVHQESVSAQLSLDMAQAQAILLQLQHETAALSLQERQVTLLQHGERLEGLRAVVSRHGVQVWVA
jgi:hypothetical protein